MNSDLKPIVSVVIPVHNGARWLGETLQSLYGQTESNIEILLIDDASTDDLSQVIKDNSDERLRVIPLISNVGVSAARNIGIEAAKGHYIAFCDADDICHSQRIRTQLLYLDKYREVGVCGSAYTCFDSEDRETIYQPASNDEIRAALMQSTCFGLSTVMGRADVLKRSPFNPSLNVAEDYDLWARLSAKGVKLGNIQESLVRYRWHPNQASRTKGRKLDEITRRVRALYAADVLNDSAFSLQLSSNLTSLQDLIRAVDLIEKQSHFENADFRFMLAWIYQLLPKHGWRELLCWIKLQRRLELDLDFSYRLNIFLLTLLPTFLSSRYFDVLIKLKR